MRFLFVLLSTFFLSSVVYANRTERLKHEIAKREAKKELAREIAREKTQKKSQTKSE